MQGTSEKKFELPEQSKKKYPALTDGTTINILYKYRHAFQNKNLMIIAEKLSKTLHTFQNTRSSRLRKQRYQSVTQFGKRGLAGTGALILTPFSAASSAMGRTGLQNMRNDLQNIAGKDKKQMEQILKMKQYKERQSIIGTDPMEVTDDIRFFASILQISLEAFFEKANANEPEKNYKKLLNSNPILNSQWIEILDLYKEIFNYLTKNISKELQEQIYLCRFKDPIIYFINDNPSFKEKFFIDIQNDSYFDNKGKPKKLATSYTEDMYFYDLPQNKKYYDFLDSSLYKIPTDITGTDLLQKLAQTKRKEYGINFFKIPEEIERFKKQIRKFDYLSLENWPLLLDKIIKRDYSPFEEFYRIFFGADADLEKVFLSVPVGKDSNEKEQDKIPELINLSDVLKVQVPTHKIPTLKKGGSHNSSFEDSEIDSEIDSDSESDSNNESDSDFEFYKIINQIGGNDEDFEIIIKGKDVYLKPLKELPDGKIYLQDIVFYPNKTIQTSFKDKQSLDSFTEKFKVTKFLSDGTDDDYFVKYPPKPATTLLKDVETNPVQFTYTLNYKQPIQPNRYNLTNKTNGEVKLFTYTGGDISELNLNGKTYLNGKTTLITTTSQENYDKMAFKEAMIARIPVEKIKVTTQ